ncbi:MAG: Bcr/CflA family multidrug efflux MFS transporter [Rhodospirillaceae bacterium]|nr:Bcr/CflA family multidrug efflux MFS transporter [Rhodospirillaceae bacterium]
MAKQASFTTIVVLLTMLVALAPTSTDLYLPSLPSIGVYFGASVSQTQLTLSAFMVGLSLGTLFYGPVSDRFGRKPPMVIGLVVFTVATLTCAFADSIDRLIALRFISAVGGCATGVLTRAMVRDMYGREEAARIFSYMGGAMALAPAVAPIIGGVVHTALGWHGQFYVLTGIGAALTLASLLILSETNKQMNPQAIDPSRLARNITHLLRHKGFIGFTFTTAFTYGGLFSFISGGSFVVIDILGVAPENFGYCFIFVAIGFISGSAVGAKLIRKLGILKTMQLGVWIGLCAGLTGLTLALLHIQNVVTVIGPVAFVFFACALVFPNALAGALAPFPDMAGTASSVTGCIQMGAGALIGASVGKLLDNTTVPLFAVITATTLMALLVYYGVVRRTQHEHL